MRESSGERKGFYGWLSHSLERRSSWVIVGTVVITLLLLLPFFLMAPTENASDSPTGSAIVRLEEQIEDTFSQEIYWMLFIMEGREGDMLTRENLLELYRNEQALKASPLSPFLYHRYMESVGTIAEGVYSIADAVDRALVVQSGGAVDLEKATQGQVDQAVESLLDGSMGEDLDEWLSVKTDRGENGWISPAVFCFVLADDEKVREEYAASVGQDYSGDIALEHFGRAVREIVRGQERGYRTWSVAIDLELEIQDEGRISFVMTVVALFLIAVLLLIIFRSWLITLVTTTGLGMLIVWLRGFSNLIGLKSSMTLDLIVPIAIVVLGVDYAIQALFRYREERDKGKPPGLAIGDSTYGVGRAKSVFLVNVSYFHAYLRAITEMAL